MDDFLSRLDAHSTLAALPLQAAVLDIETPGRRLGELLSERLELPGVVVTEGDSALRGVVSRSQYLRLVGRYLGPEVYHPRPIRRMLEALAIEEQEAAAAEPRQAPPQPSAPTALAATTPVPEALRLSLARPRLQVYEPLPVEVVEATGLRAVRMLDFRHLLRADARISELRNRQMTQILDTVSEGFLLVDRDHRVADEHSRSAIDLFGTERVGGSTLGALVSATVGERPADLAVQYLDTLFDPNVIERLVVGINPLRRVATHDGRHLAFRFVRSRDAASRIDRVMVRVDDVSREVALETEVEASRREAEERVTLVFDILGLDPSALAALLDAVESALDDARAWFATPSFVADSAGRDTAGLDAVFRRLHTSKGEAGVLGFNALQRSLHAAEEALSALRTAPAEEGSPAGERKKEEVRQAIEATAALVESVRELVDRFRTLGDRVGRATSPPSAEPPSSDGPGLLASMSDLTGRLADQFGKPARFLSRVGEAEIPLGVRPLLREILSHLVRNAMVHGVEAPTVRRRLGKPATATLQLGRRLHPAKGVDEWIFQDDGGGLDFVALSREAESLGLDEASGDRRRLAALIFRPGVSTATETTVDAGRGVGLDAVAEAVRARGGRVVAHSEPGRFCAFQIALPLGEAAGAGAPATPIANAVSAAAVTAPATAPGPAGAGV